MIAIALIAFFSCKSPLRGARKLSSDLEGNWLVVMAYTDNANSAGKRLYNEIKDSIASMSSLKIVSFGPGGEFRQMDSLKGGQWVVTEDKQLHVSGGGKGFENFKAGFFSYEGKTMILQEDVLVKDRATELRWNLHKIPPGHDVNELLEPEANKWRVRPNAMETSSQLRRRLIAMLTYYWKYFEYVGKTADFFSYKRILLPFNFYQRGMGLPKWKQEMPFNQFFYNDAQAKQAHGYLDDAMSDLKGSYPSNDNWVLGYSMFMESMAAQIEKGILE